MNKVLLSVVLLFLMSACALSQDIITLKSGEQIRSKVIEIGPTEVKYRKFDNQTGPLYILAKSEVALIVYENGTSDSFSSGQTKKNAPVSSTSATASGTPGAMKASEKETSKGRFLIGTNLVYPTGTWPATALSDVGTRSSLKGEGHTVKSFGFGIMIQAPLAKNFSLFFDVNNYNYNIFLAEKGSDVQSTWTEEQSALHRDEPGAPQEQYVNDLQSDVHFDMQTTGLRLGVKYSIGQRNIRPWLSLAWGFYKWEANYYNEDKSQSYGSDDGYSTGFTFLAGIDFEPAAGIVISPFIDVASPVARYNMEGLFYPQWNIEYDSPVMGTTRIGITMSFSPPSRNKER